MLQLMIIQLLGLMSPGPDFLYILKMAASNSYRNTVAAIIGVTLGVLFWAVSTIFGLALLFTSYPLLHKVILVLGGGYLVYLGFVMLKSSGVITFETRKEEALNKSTTVTKEIVKGLLVNLSNAKAIVYFASVMSFLLVNMTETWQIVITVFIIVAETFLYFYTVAIIFSGKKIKYIYTQYGHYFDKVAGVVFSLFGGYLIYSGIIA